MMTKPGQRVNKEAMSAQGHFFSLEPQDVLMAAETAGMHPTGEFLQLNSYENRVFDIYLEQKHRIISKFYRPGRWSEASILEEHSFLQELKDENLTAVSPLFLPQQSTILKWKGLFASFFPRMSGRMPQEFLDGELVKIGRLMAQVHNIGARKKALHRPTMDSHYYGGWPTLEDLQKWLPGEIRQRYNEAAETVLMAFEDTVHPGEFIRIHGDCHKGNLLQFSIRQKNLPPEDGFYLIDFDDFCNGPVVQDFWMLFSGDAEGFAFEKEELLRGYEELREFPGHQWDWIPVLRGLRIISYAGWIAKRWTDPSFPRLFPEFNTYKYWAEEVEALEKIAWQL